MKIKIKKILSLLLVSVLTFTLFGCEKKSGTGVAVKTVRLQIWATADEANIISAISREFVSKSGNPGLSVQTISFADDAELQNFLVDKMAEGNQPDVIYTSGNWIAGNRKKLIPLEGDKTFSPFKFEETFVRAAMDALVFDNKIWGVPMAIDSLALFYNEDHLANSLENRNKPGKTWAVFRKDTEALNRQDNSFERFSISGAAMGRMDNLNYGFEILENLMVQMGVRFFSEAGDTSRISSSSGFSRDGKRENFGVSAVNFFTSFSDSRFKNFSWTDLLADAYSSEKEYDPFVQEKVSMVFGFAKDFERLKNLRKKRDKVGAKIIPEKSIRVAFLPQIEDPNSSHTREVVAKVKALAVPRTAKNPETAWRFLKFAIKEDNLRSFFNETNLPTPRLSLIPEQEAEPGIGIFVRQAKFARPNLTPMSKKEIIRGLKDVVIQVNNGKGTSNKGLQNLESILTGKLRRKASHERAIGQRKKKEEESKKSEGGMKAEKK